MQLSFILDQARHGELASVSKKDKSDQVIVGYINLALIALYNKFQLSSQEAIITLRPDLNKVLYSMDGTDTDVEVLNGGLLRPGSFMAIIVAYAEDGTIINVNSDKDPKSIYTASYDLLQIPLLQDSEGNDISYVSIIYRENPELVAYVDDGNGNATDVDVKVPMQLLEAMLHYIGYRAHGAVNGNVRAENNTHYTRFLRACEEATMLGLLPQYDSTGPTVTEKGFL